MTAAKMLFKHESGRLSKIDRPAWANDPDNMLKREDVDKFNDTDFAIPPRMEFEGAVLRADIVTRGEGDLIFHFRDIKHSDFRNALAEVVESHFGSTDNFRVDQVPELTDMKKGTTTWGLLAKGVRLHPMFNLKFYAEEFLWLLDKVLKDTR